MFKNRSEAHERVLNVIEDVKSCCEVKDDFHEWSDIAASSIQAFLEDLSDEQLDDTCAAFREYIKETSAEDENLAKGVKDALTICLNEMLDYIGDASEDEDEDYYSDYDRETVYLTSIIKSEIKRLEEMNVQEVPGGDK